MTPDLAIGERWDVISNFQRIQTIAGTARAVHRPEQTVRDIVH